VATVTVAMVVTGVVVAAARLLLSPSFPLSSAPHITVADAS